MLGAGGHPWTCGAAARGRLVHHAAPSRLAPGTSSNRHRTLDKDPHSWQALAPASDARQWQPGFRSLPARDPGRPLSALWSDGAGCGGRADRKHGLVPGTVQLLVLRPAAHPSIRERAYLTLSLARYALSRMTIVPGASFTPGRSVHGIGSGIAQEL